MRRVECTVSPQCRNARDAPATSALRRQAAGAAPALRFGPSGDCGGPTRRLAVVRFATPGHGPGGATGEAGSTLTPSTDQATANAISREMCMREMLRRLRFRAPPLEIADRPTTHNRRPPRGLTGQARDWRSPAAHALHRVSVTIHFGAKKRRGDRLNALSL